MRARDRHDLAADSGAARAVAAGVVAIGEPVEDERAARRLQRFEELTVGAFVWTRVDAGAFRLGRISGGLRPADAAFRRATGLRHVRRALWMPLHFDALSVPRAVAETFARGGLNLQRIDDPDVGRQTAERWEGSA